jgi:hypothetical protein
MISARTLSLLAAATALSGWLAGAALDRSAVATPIWQALGPEAWAHFSDHAVYGTGITMDGVLGVLAAAIIFAAAVSATFDRDSDRATPGPLILAVVFSLLGLLFTAKAADLVQLLAAAQPAADLQPIFDEYMIWGVDFRAAAAAVAFIALVWALSDLRLAATPARDAQAAAAASTSGGEIGGGPGPDSARARG